jgi:hypothetical protein
VDHAVVAPYDDRYSGRFEGRGLALALVAQRVELDGDQTAGGSPANDGHATGESRGSVSSPSGASLSENHWIVGASRK